jgi:hypothetical protein
MVYSMRVTSVFSDVRTVNWNCTSYTRTICLKPVLGGWNWNSNLCFCVMRKTVCVCPQCSEWFRHVRRIKLFFLLSPSCRLLTVTNHNVSEVGFTSFLRWRDNKSWAPDRGGLKLGGLRLVRPVRQVRLLSSCYLNVTPRPRFTPRERTPGSHWTGGRVGFRAGLDTEARGKILCRGSNYGCPVCSHALYWLSCRSSVLRYGCPECKNFCGWRLKDNTVSSLTFLLFHLSIALCGLLYLFLCSPLIQHLSPTLSCR